MRTRSRWLAGGIVAALLVALIGSAAASGFVLGLDSPDTSWPIGTEANLNVSVDPVFVGGHGMLFRRIGGSWNYVKCFEFDSASFTTTGPIPNDPQYAGMDCEFRYFAFAPGGAPIGGSPIAKKPVPPIEIE